MQGIVNGKCGLSPKVAAVVAWFVLGQVLMFYLKAIPPTQNEFSQVVDLISKLIPTVDSVRDAKVFDSEIGRSHHALVWLLSFPFSALLIGLARYEQKQIREVYRTQKLLGLAIIFFSLALMNAALDFYTGVYSFGLANTSAGFALLSCFSALVLPLAVNFIATYVFGIDKGEEA